MSVVRAKAFWPLSIDLTNRVFYYKVGATDYSVNIAINTYLSVDLLIAALQTALNAGADPLTWTVTVNDTTGKITVSADGAWTTRFAAFVANTSRLVLGFAATDTASVANAVTADYQHQNGFYPNAATSDDSLPVRDRRSDVVTRTMEGQTKTLAESELTNRTLIFRWLTPVKTYIDFESTSLNEAIERWWQDGRAKFRYWPDATVEGTSYDYTMDLTTIQEFKPKRMKINKGIYEVTIGCFKYVA